MSRGFVLPSQISPLIAGKVLQVVTGTTAEPVTNSTTTPEDTKLTQTITPTSTSSKVLVLVNHTECYKSAGNAETSMRLKLYRDAVSIGGTVSQLYTGTAIVLVSNVNITVLDSPATTSAVTYKTKFWNAQAAASVTVQTNNTKSTIILMEISA